VMVVIVSWRLYAQSFKRGSCSHSSEPEEKRAPRVMNAL
jgi:hypothetical protein